MRVTLGKACMLIIVCIGAACKCKRKGTPQNIEPAELDSVIYVARPKHAGCQPRAHNPRNLL